MKTKKVCKEEVFGFERTVSKFKCIPITEEKEDQKEVCEENSVVDGQVKCTKFKTVYKTEACDKWDVTSTGKTTCIHNTDVWPKFSCVSHLTHNGEQFCHKMVFFKPRFICDKYEIINGAKHCVEMKNFYGKNFHTFVCV